MEYVKLSNGLNMPMLEKMVIMSLFQEEICSN